MRWRRAVLIMGGRSSIPRRSEPWFWMGWGGTCIRSEEHTSELQSLRHLVCRLLLEKIQEHILDRLFFFAIIVEDCQVDAEDQRAVSFKLFFNDTATTEIYTLSLHDALPI